MTRILLASAATLALASCNLFNKGGDNYDTTGADAAYDTSNPYGVPGGVSGESVPYQPVNPPADNPTYSQAAYEETAPVAPSAPSVSPAAGATTHTVVKGDTLWGISRKYGVTVDAIKRANGMTKDTVVLGTTIQIPAR